jgi:Tfp pilus assembly protein PilV
MKRYEQLYENRRQPNQEEGFTLIEVSIATLITMVGLMSLASLFTYAMYQNKHVKQHTAATALAQQKLEELTAIEKDDARLDIGGSLGEADKQAGYWDELNVNDKTGVVSPTPDGTLGNYKR